MVVQVGDEFVNGNTTLAPSHVCSEFRNFEHLAGGILQEIEVLADTAGIDIAGNDT